MPRNGKSNGCHCSGRFWWGVLAGVILAVVIHAAVMCCRCPMRGGPGCPMAGGAAPTEKAPAK